MLGLKRRVLPLIAAGMFAWSAAHAEAPPPPPVDKSGKGAVLCTWMMVTLAREASRQCKLNDQDAAFDRELDRSISRIEAFILENAKKPPRDIRRARQNMIDDQFDRRFCGASGEFYSHFLEMGPQGLSAWIDDDLSVPREPLMNPCI